MICGYVMFGVNKSNPNFDIGRIYPYFRILKIGSVVDVVDSLLIQIHATEWTWILPVFPSGFDNWNKKYKILALWQKIKNKEL